MTLREVLTEGERKLSGADIAEAKLNAWYLFSYVFSLNRSEFYMQYDAEADPALVERYRDLLVKRSLHVPLEYIMHSTEFMGLSFYVDENVLIPRQDTECLVEEVLGRCGDKDVLDLCTGSGCIGISLAALGKCRSVTMTDISAGALAVAKRNAEKNLQAQKIFFQKSNLFEQIIQKYDIIVSNPPYIRREVVRSLMPEVRDHEPVTALDGGEDGLVFYRSIIQESRKYLKDSGWLFFEIGYDQGEDVSVLMQRAGFENVEIKKDLAGLDRIVCGQIGGNCV